MASTNPARGMRDFLPADVRKRDYVIGIIKEVYESYGFEPLETPAVENIETLMGKYGKEGNQLIFKILERGEKLQEGLNLAALRTLNAVKDLPDDIRGTLQLFLSGDRIPDGELRGYLAKASSIREIVESVRGQGRDSDFSDLALRYDLTVPLARVAANRKNDIPKFFKRYQIQPVWRADRPAKGRFREFYQCDVDAIGSSSMVVEAELISAASEILTRLSFKDFVVRINHREILTDILDTAGIPSDLHGDSLVAIDKLDKIGSDGVAKELADRGVTDAASTMLLDIFEQTQQIVDDGKNVNRTIVSNLINIVSNEVLTEIGQILKFADNSPIQIDPSLARGLSYYTGTIMEINVPDLAGSLAGGGRYDGLIGMFGKEQIPACGFSLGLERILVVMEERGMFPPEIAEAAPADVMVTIWSEETIGESLKLANDLRSHGIRVTVYPEPDKFGKQMKYADLIKVPFVAILGENEIAAGKVKIKNMKSGDEQLVIATAAAAIINKSK